MTMTLMVRTCRPPLVDGDQPTYTIAAAARRVGRTRRTIRRWLDDGMPHRIVAGMVVIDHWDLLDAYRARVTEKRRNFRMI
ncbi:helix-turn-helix domain-containing protein [Agromyces larvae]|uniref:Helix-turn-helix domain-containing protein n=1 Tax=Agromyces larvae TaxID=2929802 RepID=A0ABY4C2R5_9MICO|nr:helix-turn-helix domain-containing protein [Agromyces larvae]UOE45489.1 helix-turn-helix domain-containing protein [Agromyces larvae]